MENILRLLNLSDSAAAMIAQYKTKKSQIENLMIAILFGFITR